jgi:hypothetical protein
MTIARAYAQSDIDAMRSGLYLHLKVEPRAEASEARIAVRDRKRRAVVRCRSDKILQAYIEAAEAGRPVSTINEATGSVVLPVIFQLLFSGLIRQVLQWLVIRNR